MLSPKEILKKYWGHDSFRDIQEDIINSILQKVDTVALLPTGGGKSICFQVPAMCIKGVCIVISPLISLMKDQVDNLGKIGIKGLCATSDVDKDLLFAELKDIIEGKSDVKFIYLSPERLQSKQFISLLKHIPINIIAVDEAHCISQWGHDFRPEYIKIASIRQYTNAPILALTATATAQVIDEIQDSLLFKKKTVFKKSFKRDNISYSVIRRDDKFTATVSILRRIKGTAIVYVRSREKTKFISDYLNDMGISSDFYHAGLNPFIKDDKQSKWKDGTIRVIVATNAFGMGIDKPDVRCVIHLGFADSLEAYVQESGRAGRDLKESKCFMILDDYDIKYFKSRVERSLLDLHTLKTIYNHLNYYYKNYQDENVNIHFEFNLEKFINRYNLDAHQTLSCLEFLKREEVIQVLDYQYTTSKLLIKASLGSILNIFNTTHKMIMYTILRTYPSLSSDYVEINEEEIAQTLDYSTSTVVETLEKFSNLGYVDYKKRNNLQTIIFLVQNDDRIINSFSKKIIAYNNRVETKATYMFKYGTDRQCRNISILNYFGESNAAECGKCDICTEKERTSEANTTLIENSILTLLKNGNLSTNDVMLQLKELEEDDIFRCISLLLEKDKIYYKSPNILSTR